jgi:hypothetical protein
MVNLLIRKQDLDCVWGVERLHHGVDAAANDTQWEDRDDLDMTVQEELIHDHRSRPPKGPFFALF